MNITYQIEFFTYWHCGSGLGAGADTDALVIKDDDDLPFVPGKTMKGLIREATLDLLTLTGSTLDTTATFGEPATNKSTALTDSISDNTTPSPFRERAGVRMGTAFFTNATLAVDLRRAVVADKLQHHLYQSIASTAIDKDGVAQNNSLRSIQVVVPCTLEGKIIGIADEETTRAIEKSLGMIKRIGQNRNRGLGRCQITIKKGGEK